MQIKSTVRYFYTPTIVAKIKNSGNTKSWWECREIGSPTYCWWECKMVATLGNSLALFVKANIQSAIALLGIYPREVKNLSSRIMHIHLYVNFVYKYLQHLNSVIFKWDAARTFKTCNTWLFIQGHWPLFPKMSNKKNDNSQHNNCPVWINQNYTYFFC